MNATDARLLELALKKQRLQFDSDTHRTAATEALRFVPPLCAGADRLRDGLHWLAERPAVPVAAGVALLVARPRGVLRWGRRAWFGWQAWRRARDLAGDLLAKART